MVTSKEVAIREVTTEVEDGSNSDWISEGNGTFRFLTEDERSPPPDKDSLLSDSVVDKVEQGGSQLGGQRAMAPQIIWDLAPIQQLL